MTFITTFIVLVLLGIIDSGYLFYKYKTKSQLSCPLHSDCNAVINSKWGKFLGVKNEIWGILFYLTLLFLIIAVYFSLNFVYLPFLIFSVTLLGVLYSIYLVFIQVKKIKEYCLYCLLSALINFLLFINGLIFWGKID